MKLHVLIAGLILSTTIAFGQTQKWGYDASHAKIGFSIGHFGISETEGKFTKFDGAVLADKSDFSDAKIEITIDVNSIDTEEAKRDEHLKSADFFDIKKHPEITFKSTSMKSTGKNKYKLTGDFTMHGVTKSITLDAVYRGTVLDPFGNTKAGFQITGTLDRPDFGLEWNGTLSAGGVLVSDEVDLDINIELTKL